MSACTGRTGKLESIQANDRYDGLSFRKIQDILPYLHNGIEF